MAEAIANNLKDREIADVEFSSAGIYAVKGQSASQNATTVMEEMGIDLSYHIASPVTEELLNEADLILTLTEGHKKTLLANHGLHMQLEDRLFTLKEYVNANGAKASTDKDIADPFGGDLSVYRVCSQQIKEQIEKLISKIKESKGNK